MGRKLEAWMPHGALCAHDLVTLSSVAAGGGLQPAVYAAHFPQITPPAMETPVAARHAKRRKPETPENPEQEDEANISPLPASSAPDSSPPAARGGPPPGAGAEEEDGVDRISLLPDAILGEVISLLPTKDAARTQTLATRWRDLWRSAPLNLDTGDLRTIDDVSRILSAHRGPGRRFRFPAQYLQDHPATVDAWLRSPALDNLQQIDCFTIGGWALSPQPASTFRFSSSLCVVALSQCILSDDITQTLQFPLLKKLLLQRVRISEDSLNNIIASSPVLEYLLLFGIFGFRCVRINSASLTGCGVGSQINFDRTVSRLEEFIVEDAPCLKRILYHRQTCVGMRVRVSVISAPNLETLGCLEYSDDSSRLMLGSTIIEPLDIKGFRVINSTMPVCSVKIFAISMYNLSLDVIIDLMRCFPCLEKLYIKSINGGEKNLWRRKHRNLCLDIRLKTVVLDHYRGIKAEVNFATFFILNAKMLESMRFQGEWQNVNEGFLAEQRQRLQLEKRASRCAQFYFTNKSCCHEFMHINHAHDMSKTDPFECVETGAGVCVPFE